MERRLRTEHFFGREAMIEKYTTVASGLRHEIEKIKGSRFIADLAPAIDVDEAMGRVARVRSEFHDARHHCWAYRLGPGGETFRSSDDGEPSGSAGRPILQQIEGAGVTDVVCVVTRYFGGTKLGVGGLVRAYGGAAAEALSRADRRTITVTRQVRFEVPYEFSGEVERLLASIGVRPVGSDYGAAISLTVELPIGLADSFLVQLRDRTSGRAKVTDPD